ncbi:thiamine pyrophosphate-binding protein [Streptomyces sclerotialus]|uniref:thiamine pyrophosphate-binding protein n=1 Tax=Streptomyces sclerotialus TaxID=1957 RepID=UPI0006905BA0
MPMPTTTAAAVAARIVRDEGADHAFGCPDAPGHPLYAALAADGIGRLTARLPQSAVHMADGWARTGGRTGVVVAGAASGPGLVPGLHTARADGVPLVCLAAGPGSAGPARPVTKRVLRAASPARLPWALREAFRTAREGRPGPVLVELSAEAAEADVAGGPAAGAPLPVRSGAPRPAQVAAVLELLPAARRPLLLAGGGVPESGAGTALCALAEWLRTPFADTPRGRGCAGDGHGCYVGTLGSPAADRALEAADCVLAIGTGRSAGLLAGVRTVVQVDADPSALGGYGTSGLGIVADARLFLEALLGAARAGTRRRSRSWAGPAGPAGAAVRAEGPGGGPIPAARVHAEIDAVFGTDPDTCFVLTEEVYAEWGGARLPVRRPRRLLLRGRGGPPGWEIPAALGARAALAAVAPDAVVVGIGAGDGLPSPSDELAVAAEYGVPYVQLLLGRDERGPDTVRIAEAYGCSGRRVTGREDLRSALAWARKETVSTRRPALVTVLAAPEA